MSIFWTEHTSSFLVLGYLEKSLFWPQTPESLLLWSFVSLPRALGHLQQLFTSDAAKESSEEHQE